MSKKNKVKHLKISLDFIHSDILFFMDKKNHNKYVDKHKMGKEWHINTGGLTTDLWCENTGHSVLIGIVDNNYDVYQIKGLIVHEISHTVDFICARHGIKDGETRAYLTQYLYVQIIQYYDKQVEKRIAKEKK